MLRHRRGQDAQFVADSALEGTGFELAVPPRRERRCGTTSGKHCRLGPEPISGSPFRAAVSDWQRPEEPFAGAGPMVRIHLPPAPSPVRTCVIPRFVGDGFGFKFSPNYFVLPPRAELDDIAKGIRNALQPLPGISEGINR